MTPHAIMTVDDLDVLDFARGDGTVTVVVQDARTRAVLMVAHADREALARTLQSGEMHFLSRSRGPWHKGATSGNVQRVIELRADCDGDAVLAVVSPAGPACHTGEVTCFGIPPFSLASLDDVVAQRATAPTPVGYTGRLLNDRNLRLKKLGEETAELVAACADNDGERAVSETADLLYHALVALRALGRGLEDVERALASRAHVPVTPPGDA